MRERRGRSHEQLDKQWDARRYEKKGKQREREYTAHAGFGSLFVLVLLCTPFCVVLLLFFFSGSLGCSPHLRGCL